MSMVSIAGKVNRNVEWLVDDDGNVVGHRKKPGDDVGVVTGTPTEVAAFHSMVSAAWNVAPKPTGDSAADFEALLAFSSAMPANARIMMPPGQYTVWAGCLTGKAGQRWEYGKDTIIKRANEVATTTNGGVSFNAAGMVVPVNSVVGFRPGMGVMLYGAMTSPSTNTALVWQAKVVSVGAVSVTIGGLTGTLPSPIDIVASAYQPAAIWGAGTILCTRGYLFDASTFVGTGRIDIEGFTSDGNRANNTSINRWEYCMEMLVRTKGGLVAGTTLVDPCGEGLVIYGLNPQVDRVEIFNANGNGVHYNSGCYDAWCNNILVDGCNLQADTMGHADGGIIASDTTYRTIVSQFRVLNSKRGGIGSWDQNDNAFAKISRGYLENIEGGALRMFAVQPSEGVEIIDVEVKDGTCSFLGASRTSNTQVAQAVGWRIRNLKLTDSTVFVSGLVDSDVDISATFGNSGTQTAASIASGRASNYDGYTLGALTSIVGVVACERSHIKVRASDGGAPANKFVVRLDDAGGGPSVGNTYDVKTKGGTVGILCNGVQIGNTGRLEAEGWTSDGVRITLAARSIDAAFSAGREKPGRNEFWCGGSHTNQPAGTYAVKAAQTTPSGWLKISGEYQTVAVAGFCYGYGTQSGGLKVRLDDVQAIGPASNFQPVSLNAPAAAGNTRLSNVRHYPAIAGDAPGAGTLVNVTVETAPVLLVA